MTEKITYGYGVISFSAELLQDMVTKGWCMEKVECIEGLPENAEFQRVFSDVNGDISLVFRIPELGDFGLYVPDKYLPRLKALWRQSYSEDVTISFPDGTKLVVHYHKSERPTFSSNAEGVVADFNTFMSSTPKLEYEVEILT